MGRQLKSISNGTNTYSYTYNEEGIRTSKTVNGVTTNYVIDNKLVKAEYTDTYSIVYWYYHYKTKNTYRSTLLEKGGKYHLCSELLYKIMGIDFKKKYSLLY